MFLDKYKALNSFNEQEIFLINKIKNSQTEKILYQEIKANFKEFLLNTKIKNSYDFNKLFLILSKEKNNHLFLFKNIITIINQEYISLPTIITILEYGNNQEILKNQKIQTALLNLINKTYKKDSLILIKRYIEFKQRKELMLKQIKFRIENNVKDKETKQFIFNFINCLINDPMFNKSFDYLSSGSYKDCFNLGDYVLQIGNGPHITKLEKCSEIASPILFRVWNGFQVSISYCLKTPVTKEEMRKCYFKARRKEIMLLDSSNPGNFGKYKKHYTHPFKNVSNTAKNFLGVDIFDLSDVKKGTVKYLDIDFYLNVNDDSQQAQKLKRNFYHEYHNQEYEYTLNNRKKTSK